MKIFLLLQKKEQGFFNGRKWNRSDETKLNNLCPEEYAKVRGNLGAKDASLLTSPGRAVQPSGPPFDGHGGLERREIEVTHERLICSSRSVRSRASESLATEEKEEEKEELFSTSDQEKPSAS